MKAKELESKYKGYDFFYFRNIGNIKEARKHTPFYGINQDTNIEESEVIEYEVVEKETTAVTLSIQKGLKVKEVEKYKGTVYVLIK